MFLIRILNKLRQNKLLALLALVFVAGVVLTIIQLTLGVEQMIKALVSIVIGLFTSVFGINRIKHNRSGNEARRDHKRKTEEINSRVDRRREESEAAVDDADNRPPPPSDEPLTDEEEKKRLDDLGPTW